jgi:uncharacterized protein (UPF0548 family)
MTPSMKSTPFTYPEVGATAGMLPSGYQYLVASRIVGTGQALFDECAETVLNWGIQSGAGLKVANPGRVLAGGENRLGLFWGPFKTWANCRVVYVVEEPNRKGFAYGTIPGHPESGEESFIVSLMPSGDVVFEIRAFSKPARWFARLGGPAIRLLQQHVTWRYLDAIHAPRIERNSLLAATRRTYNSPDHLASVSTGSPKSHSKFAAPHHG